MPINPQEYYKQVPELEEICLRLEESLKESREKNKKLKSDKKEASPSEPFIPGKAKRDFEYIPEHCVISGYLKNNYWEGTAYRPKPGRKEFENAFSALISTRQPDAVRVEIFKGKGERGKPDPIYRKDIYLTDSMEVRRALMQGEEMQSLGAIIERVESLEKSNRSDRPDSEVQSQLQLLRDQLKEQQQQAVINDLKLRHENELNRLKDAIAEKEKEIQELKEEIKLGEGELNGIAEELREVKDPPLVSLLSNVAGKALENFARNNPKFLTVGLGLTDEQLKAIWAAEEKQLGTGEQRDDNSSFESNDEYAGLDEKHAAGLHMLTRFFKQLRKEEFAKIYTIVYSLHEENTGRLKQELADKMLRILMPDTATKTTEPFNSQNSQPA